MSDIVLNDSKLMEIATNAAVLNEFGAIRDIGSQLKSKSSCNCSNSNSINVKTLKEIKRYVLSMVDSDIVKLKQFLKLQTSDKIVAFVRDEKTRILNRIEK